MCMGACLLVYQKDGGSAATLEFESNNTVLLLLLQATCTLL
jgi:hypothetical protein